jgi:hypothetical protein
MQHVSDSTEKGPLSLRARMIIGAGVGLAIILVFILPAGNGNPAWGKYWMIRPLLVTPFAGAMAGLCNYYILRYRFIIGMNKAVAMILSIVVSIVGLWMGIVLGLAGTMWD